MYVCIPCISIVFRATTCSIVSVYCFLSQSCEAFTAARETALLVILIIDSLENLFLSYNQLEAAPYLVSATSQVWNLDAQKSFFGRKDPGNEVKDWQ